MRGNFRKCVLTPVLAQQGFRQAAMARHLGLWRTSVRRVLMQQEGTCK